MAYTDNIEPKDIKQYRFTIEPIKVIVNGDIIHTVNPLEILQVSIEKDFTDSRHTMIGVQMTLPPKIYQTIQNGQDNVQFKVRIQVYEHDQNSSNYSMKTDIINDMLTSYMTNRTPILDVNAIDRDNVVDDSPTKLKDFANAYTFFMFKEQSISSGNSNVNTVLTNTTLTNAITYILSKSNCKNVLMAPIDNSEVYEEILLPPFTTLGHIRYMDQFYGIYEEGTICFYDFDAMYILPRSNKCRVHRSGEYEKVFLMVSKSSNEMSTLPGGVTVDSEKYHRVNVTKEAVAITGNSLTGDVTKGNTTLMIDGETGGNTIPSNVEQRGSGQVGVETKKYDNPYLESMKAVLNNESNLRIDVYLNEVTLEHFTPNKEYVLVFEEADHQKYNGSYRLSAINAYLYRNGENYIGNMKLILLKSEK